MLSRWGVARRHTKRLYEQGGWTQCNEQEVTQPLRQNLEPLSDIELNNDLAAKNVLYQCVMRCMSNERRLSTARPQETQNPEILRSTQAPGMHSRRYSNIDAPCLKNYFEKTCNGTAMEGNREAVRT